MVEALTSGLPREYIPLVIRAAEKGYLLGYNDKTIERNHNTVYYDPQEILRVLAEAPEKSS